VALTREFPFRHYTRDRGLRDLAASSASKA
jgi:hypothetical protein